eukprot:Nitzschia sp. Nitz4//scaffold91_size79674//33678//34502//NITZ4_005366-RA/size79674-processed-gene-0.107-mRNA-1//-1//CDS//3329560097//5342//frame0
MFSRFLAAQNAAHHNQTLTVLPLHHSRRCFTSSGPSSPTSSSGGVSASKYWIFAWYSRQLERRPLLTKAVTSGVLAGVGDIVCQYLSYSHTITHHADTTATLTDSFWASIDWSRTAKFLGMGAFWVAPITHVWYHALSVRILPGSRTRSKVLQRLFVDQLIFAPLFVPTFLGGLWWLEGYSNAVILEKLWEATPSAVQANWTLWIPAQLVNFGWVPLRYQVLFGNVVALLWNVYVSWLAHYYGDENHSGNGGNDDAMMTEHMVPPSTLAGTPSA